MRPKLFDFAKENKVKILELTAHNKNLETLFREFTN
jgi:ABC-2 type transport system ATP-binding protein